MRRDARRRRPITIAVAALAIAAAPARPAAAHVGSPDVFFEGQAGPYALLVTVQPPAVIPGVATVEIQAPNDQLRLVTIVPTPLRGPGAALPPTADVAHVAADDAHRFAGRLWLMAPGSWQVRVHVDGARGPGDLAVPVPALALRTKTMQRGLGLGLTALLAFLVAAIISIVGASVREAPLGPGEVADPARRRRARIAQAATFIILSALVAMGGAWWGSEATRFVQQVYKPLGLEARADGAALSLTLIDHGGARPRRLDDLVPDHGHLMHLFLLRIPAMDVVAHLHPEPDGTAPGHFQHELPSLPAGEYQLFADIVHETGLSETATATLTLPAVSGRLANPDDAAGQGSPLDAPAGDTTTLGDGTRVVWLRDAAAPLRAGRTTWFRFRVDGPEGQPATDVVPYMGMAGHAVFAKDDRSVFAHIHPTGSVSMATLAVMDGAQADPHAGHHMHATALPPEIAFPYGCPQPGRYRIVVQFKRGQTIETAFFAATVADR